jgi:GWxTD domain-containing protein
VPRSFHHGETVSMLHAWGADQLPFGRSRVRVRLELASGGERLSWPREPALDLLNLHAAVTQDEAWQRQLQWLRDVLPKARRDSLASLVPADREGAWQLLWQGRGARQGLEADQALERHLRRVIAADDRFSGSRRGSLTDRGRLLIEHGEPATVEQMIDRRTAGARWEIWEYPTLDLRVFFYDAHGLGDFRRHHEEPLSG